MDSVASKWVQPKVMSASDFIRLKKAAKTQDQTSLYAKKKVAETSYATQIYYRVHSVACAGQSCASS